MKRFRIDFTIRELDCSPKDAQSITFGDEVDSTDIFDFFNRCRDGVVTLFDSTLPKKSLLLTKWDELSNEVDELKKKAKATGTPVMRAAQRLRDMEPLEFFNHR